MDGEFSGVAYAHASADPKETLLGEDKIDLVLLTKLDKTLSLPERKKRAKAILHCDQADAADESDESDANPGDSGDGEKERKSQATVLVEMVIFIATVFVAYVYVWRRGGLEWD